MPHKEWLEPAYYSDRNWTPPFKKKKNKKPYQINIHHKTTQ